MRPGATGQRGGALVEAVVATAILALTLTPILALFMMSGGALGDSEEYMAALNLARAQMERSQATEFAQLGPSAETVTLGTIAYTVTTAVRPRPARDWLRDVTVTVTWPGRLNFTRTVSISSSIGRR